MLPKIGEIPSASLIIILTVYLDQRNKNMQRETVDVVNFHLGQLVMSEIAPFLRGFCGDFVRGVEQLAGLGMIQSPLRTAKTSE